MTYAIVEHHDHLPHSQAEIIHLREVTSDEEGVEWHRTEAPRGAVLVRLDLARGEEAEEGDIVAVDEDGVAELIRD